jgi:hypothetical protein
MQWRVGLATVALFMEGCNPTSNAPAKSYRSLTDQWIVRLGLPRVGIWPCKDDKLDFDECYKMEPSREWRGLWVTQFEDYHFCPNAEQTCASAKQPRYRLWWNRKVFTHRPPVGAKTNRSYELEFIGRSTKYSVDGWDSHNEIVVDRLISMKDLGPTPGLPQLQE